MWLFSIEAPTARYQLIKVGSPPGPAGRRSGPAGPGRWSGRSSPGSADPLVEQLRGQVPFVDGVEDLTRAHTVTGLEHLQTGLAS